MTLSSHGCTETDSKHLPKPERESDFERPVAWLLGRRLISALKQIALFVIFSDKLDPRDWMHASVHSVRGQNADELVESNQIPSEPPNGEFWFDYISDSGDGQLPMYDIAYLCFSDMFASSSQPTAPSTITLVKQDYNYLLPRGQFLLVGGDTAYHIADYITLARRFQAPFEWAASEKGITRRSPRRPLLGIPGNHDYYDVVDGFNRQFRRPTSKEDHRNRAGLKPQLSIPGFKRVQTASYTALRLPFDWWLWAADTEINDVDIRQQEFFKELAETYQVKKLILATSEPTTVFGRSRWDCKPAKAVQRLGLPRPFLHTNGSPQSTIPEDLIPGTCRIDLSGDVHHYARYWGPLVRGDYASVVSGLGGAFLHPSQTDAGEVRAQVKFPCPKQSRYIVMRELLGAVTIIHGGYIWLIGGLLAAIISFSALVVPSSRAAVNAVLSRVASGSQSRLAQPSGIIVTNHPVLPLGSAAQRDDFLCGALLWILIAVIPIGLFIVAVMYLRKLAREARCKVVKPHQYWPIWLFTIMAAVVVLSSVWKLGANYAARELLADLLFVSAIVGTPVLLAGFGWSGAHLYPRKWKLLVALLGCWHGILQAAVPFLLVRLGNMFTLLLTSIVLLVAASVGTLLAKYMPLRSPGADLPFGVVLFVLWVTFNATATAAALWVPFTFHWTLSVSSARLAVLCTILLSAGAGMVLSCVNLGWYLAVALAFNCHNNEAGGAARIASFKQMIRFRLTKEGLTGFVVAFKEPNLDASKLELELVDIFTICPRTAESSASR